MRWIESLAVAVAAVAVQPAPAGQAYDELYRLYDYPKTLERSAVPVCFHHGCASVKRVTLKDAQWQQVTRHFAPPGNDAAAERGQIRQAIAEMERITGELAGTSGDIAGDLASFGTLDPQMDCIDESSNTTTYLTLFEQAGLLRWHSVEPRATRGYLFWGGWPHYTAMIRDRQTGQQWVVDSWFRDNGELPDVVELDTWKDGWKPEGFTF
ncbi:MAG: hypothetical protein WBM81_12170 [Sedimenticolaceae bacterium]